MKDRSLRAFTLIELAVVVVVIGVLVGLVLAISRLATWKAAKETAQIEILALRNACDAYKTDNGTLPSERSNR